MARRPAFFVDINKWPFYTEREFEFEYNSGFAVCQKKKNVSNLHDAIKCKYPNAKILEVSTKSDDQIGFELSAFNLKVNVEGKQYPLECVFQSSKVFENDGEEQYNNFLINVNPFEVKKKLRELNDGALKYFKLGNKRWELSTGTAFYDFLYCNALFLRKDLLENLLSYDVFTDIEFNPKKSINCQAKTICKFIALYKKGILEEAIGDVDKFLELYNKPITVQDVQDKLF